MKYILFLLTLIGLVSCNSNVEMTEKQTPFTIDSVEYHGVGHDNTLQVSPYYKLHLMESDAWIRSNFKYSKGDTIIVSVRRFNKRENPNPDWYNYTH